tara:strand:- start:200 stop:382 length:183 start_codon:yes stop_codon:yes gene_type:complete
LIDPVLTNCGCHTAWPKKEDMNKKEIIEEIKAILKDYYYDSDTENMSKDVVIALENLVKN